MSDLSVTNTFVPLTTIVSSQVNANFSDIVNYINNRDDGTSTWDNMNVTATVGNPVTIKSNQSTTEVAIDNTATDGDSMLTFKLSGAQTHVIGVDDSDSDFLKFGTTGITTNVAMQIPTTGVQIQFAVGSAAVPSASFIGRTTDGFYSSSAGNLGLSISGAALAIFNSLGIVMQSGSLSAQDGTLSALGFNYVNDPNTGMTRNGADVLAFVANGAIGAEVDATGTAGTTRLLIFDVDNGQLERVTVGVADSGGAGFKLLRIPN